MTDSSFPDPQIAGDLEAIDAALEARGVEPARQPLADLAVLLRDERATPGPEVARRLDDRMAIALESSGARPPVRRRLRGWRMSLATASRGWWPAFAAVACVLLAAVIVLDELSGGPVPGGMRNGSDAAVERAVPGGEGTAAGRDSQEPAPAGDSAGESIDPGMPSAGGGGLSDPTDSRERRLVEHSAFVTLTTEPGRLPDVASRIVRVVDDVGGFVASSTVGEVAGQRGGASFELRVPVRELPRTLAALSRLAQVRERSESTRDVTADTGRAARRVAELRAERRGLLRALERATGARERGRIRARLRVVERRTVAARAEVRRLRSRAAFATVGVNLVVDPDGAAGGDGRWTPGDAVRTAIRVLEVAVGVAIVAAALAVPLAIVAVALVFATRLAARRRRSRPPDAG